MIKFESENHLKKFIIENYESIEDLSFFDNISDEVELGGYGRVDLLSWEVNLFKNYEILCINLYELKNVITSYKELGQICRYITGIKRYLYKNDNLGYADVEVNGFLVAPCFDLSSDFTLLYNEVSYNIEIVEFNLHPLNGIEFEVKDKSFTLFDENLPKFENFLSNTGLEVSNNAKK